MSISPPFDCWVLEQGDIVSGYEYHFHLDLSATCVTASAKRERNMQSIIANLSITDNVLSWIM